MNDVLEYGVRIAAMYDMAGLVKHHAQSVRTPDELVSEICTRLQQHYTGGRVLVFHNVEFVMGLIVWCGVSPDKILFVDDGGVDVDTGEYVSHKHHTLRHFGIPDKHIFPEYVFNKIASGEMKRQMKFDIIVANPPYQDATNAAKNNKLWHKFVKRFCSTDYLTDGGYVAIVCPDSIFKTDVGIGKWFSDRIDSGYFSLLHARAHEKQQYFKENVDTCDFLLRMGKYGGVEIPSKLGPIDKSIINKMIGTGKFLPLEEENKHITSSSDGSGDIEVLRSGKKTFNVDLVDPSSVGRLKLVISFSSSYSRQFITTEPTCQYNRVVYISSEAEGENIMSYTLSPLYRYFAEVYKKTVGFTPAVKNKKLPLLDYSRKWTDDEVYDYFGITEEERAYIVVFLSTRNKRQPRSE